MNWELRMILVTLFVAAASAAPLNLVNSAVQYAHVVAAVAYAAAPVPYPAALTYAVPEPVANAVQPQITYDFPAVIAKPAPTPVKVEYDILGPIAAPAPAPVIRVAAPVKIEYDFPAPISAPAPAPVVVTAPAPITYAAPAPVKVEYDFPAPISAPAPTPVVAVAAPVKVEYDFPAPISAPAPAPVPVAVAAPAPITYAAPAPVAYAAPAPVAYAAPAPVHVVPQAFETRVHYAETPVVVGHTSTIMKPNLGAGAHVTNFDFMGLAQTKTVGQESFVQKSKVLAPARTVSEITPQVTVQHPTKVNVEKFAVEVPVAAPYAQPVPVPVAPQYEIHQYHAPAAVYLAVHFYNSASHTTATIRPI
ncbi:calphotin-like isoform X2 [Daphnia pulex]|uniref:calphotin-like isoform X2 n=1 Tax=Daphnia pulex TaxID=6669 RepID=UPI001EE117EA|nr:calphotin-like isoform X2 [Daphnia pulex]